MKYVPQAYVNYKRKSTIGWSIAQILFDLVGGGFSLIQVILDSCYDNDWSGITGNPAKFLLANITIVFDLVFVIQHYVLYRGSGDKTVQAKRVVNSQTPLLADRDNVVQESV